MRCTDCYLSGPVCNLGKSVLCRFGDRVVPNECHGTDCAKAITDADVKAAEEEHFKYKLADGEDFDQSLEQEIRTLQRDISRVKLEREKLRLEKEQVIALEDSWDAKFRGATRGVPYLKPVIKYADFLRDCYKNKTIKSLPMQNFLCENCGEVVQVPVDQVGEKVHWKCMVCHQQNSFEVVRE